MIGDQHVFPPPSEAAEQLLEIHVIFGKVKLKRLNPWVVYQVCARRMLNKLWLLLQGNLLNLVNTGAYERKSSEAFHRDNGCQSA